jgi:hypothetical protein
MRGKWLLMAVPLLIGAALLSSPRPAFAETTPTPEPILMVDTFRTTPSSLVVGQQFKLTLTVINNSSAVTGKNVVVSVGNASLTATSSTTATSASTGSGIVVLGSNTKFVGDIGTQAKGSAVTFDLTSNIRSPAGACSVPVVIAYDTASGRQSITQSVGFVLTRPLVFDVSALEYPRVATAGQPFTVAASVNNTNDFPISGVAIAFRSDEATLQSGETTVGLLDVGKSATLRTTATASRTGLLSMTLVIGYRDDFGQRKEVRRDFTVTVQIPKQQDLGLTQRTGQSSGLRARLVAVLKAFLGLGG